MKTKLKHVPMNVKFLMVSNFGIGLSLFEKTGIEYPHGEDCLNLFTGEIEFHHWKYDDNTESLCFIVEDGQINDLVTVSNQCIL